MSAGGIEGWARREARHLIEQARVDDRVRVADVSVGTKHVFAHLENDRSARMILTFSRGGKSRQRNREHLRAVNLRSVRTFALAASVLKAG